MKSSIAVEEDESLTKSASTSAAAIPFEEGSGDENEEMVLPAMCGKVDPAVLAALPPSMQLDLLVQMRESLMAENRQRYQKVKKAPEKFSELQIEAYLKTVAFRREIDQVQKAAAGTDVGGVQTSRIASEANREFIFSSSFTGDKQLFTSAGMQRNGNEQQQTPIGYCPSDSVDHVASTSKSNTITGMLQDESTRVFDEDVETYLDERGNIRVSRVRAMGMRMTRDLQRNLDLMKEIEQERTCAMKSASAQSELNKKNIGSSERISSKKHHIKNSHGELNNRNGQSSLDNERSINISFDVDVDGESKGFDSDDNIFTSLVAGKPVKIDSASDSDWEEGIIEGRDNNSSNDMALETNPPPRPKESNISDDSEVDWEEGVCDVHDSSLPSESGRTASRGYLEEEADLQEAIRRSLEGLGCEKLNQEPSELENLISTKVNTHNSVIFIDQEDNAGGRILVEKDVSQQNKPSPEILAFGKLDSMGQNDVSKVYSSSDRQLKAETHYPPNMGVLTNKSCTRNLGSNAGQSNEDKNIGSNLCRETPSAETAAPLEVKDVHVMVEQFSDTFVGDIGLSTSKMYSSDGSHVSGALSGNMSSSIPVNDELNEMEAEPSMLVNEERKPEPSRQPVEISKSNPSIHITGLSNDSTIGTDIEANLVGKKISDYDLDEKEHYMNEFARNENLQAGMSEASLREEILTLGQEFTNLGDEQKKLERNAESVSGEMFAECQELLQMFGLPYIIAPMEAEAQCAYMELANLVDGVVTDDSDVFLFGARSVYKNIFEDRKYVETYYVKDIEKELGLTREKLIRMALLLGSDYTEGISGIGIVNAIEVVNAFPEEDGLKKFREWIESPDPTILEKFGAQNGSGVRKRGSKVGDDDTNCANSNVDGINSFGQNIPQGHEQDQSADYFQEIKQVFMDKHRNVSKNWHVPSSFPSEAVISAYSSPQVDKSTEPFTWGKPDLQVLRRLCWEKFGWGIQKSDELLLPVLKEYDKHETQLRLEAFYTFNERFAKIRSKRIKKAVKGITGNLSSELMDDDVNSKSRRKGTIRPGESGDTKPERPSKRAKGGSNKIKSLENSTTGWPRKRTTGVSVSSEVENPGKQWQAESRQSNHKGSRGVGRGKGRGRGCGRGKGRARGTLGFEQSDSSPDDVSGGGDDELEVDAEKSERPQEVRRSLRSRKPASYTVDDLEIDDVDKSLHHGDTRLNEEVLEAGISGVQGECKSADASLNGEEQHKVEDSLPEDFSEDYLEQAVGFVADEDGSGQAGVAKNTYPSEPGVSNDYLAMGGGFCVDESDTGTYQDVCHRPSMAAEWETVDSSHFTGLMEEAASGKSSFQLVSSVKRSLNDSQDGGKTNAFDTELSVDCINERDTGDHSKLSLPLPESTENDAGGSSIRSLSAMPFLKRKRRKI
ncbi:DNA repair protein UVH3 isoform X2 [Hevea brasiliensis]|uniref:DNA repair protein UVH3 isoform X2 n=1 Tax=Hevea brasiliensis TaxID=3981 RepID=UPI002600C869|nr:DNA repair protein UVH3 isoform X2 [Hevea brasiliensis]